MSVRADLHIHTTASDGTWTPAELIAEAQKQQLGLIAVTDHDSVANVAEAMTVAPAAGIRDCRQLKSAPPRRIYRFIFWAMALISIINSCWN